MSIEIGNIRLSELPPAEYISAVKDGDMYTAETVAAPYDPMNEAAYESNPTMPVGANRSFPMVEASSDMDAQTIAMPHAAWEPESHHFPCVIAFDLPASGALEEPAVISLEQEDIIQLIAEHGGGNVKAGALNRSAIMKVSLDGHTFDAPYALQVHEGSSNPKKLHRSCFMKTSERGLYQIGHPLINKNTPAVVYARGKGLTADERNFSMLSMNDLVEGIVEMDYGNGNISYGYPKNKLLPYLKWLFEVKNKIVDRIEHNPAYIDHHDPNFLRIPPNMHEAFIEAYSRKLNSHSFHDCSRISFAIHPLSPGKPDKDEPLKRMYLYTTISAQIPTENPSQNVVSMNAGASDLYE